MEEQQHKDNYKSVSVAIERDGEALDVFFSDLAGNLACQPYQFQNDSNVAELLDYMSYELACSVSDIVVYHQAEIVPEHHEIANYMALTAAVHMEPTPENAFARLQERTQRDTKQRQELSRVISVAASRAKDAGAEISNRVRSRVNGNIERLCLSEEEAFRCYLREAAVDASLTRAFATRREIFQAEVSVRLALQSSDVTDYEEMVAKGERAVQVGCQKSVSLVQVTKYKREGVELVLSLSPVSSIGESLGEDFSHRVNVGVSVAEVMAHLRAARVCEVGHAERLIRGVSSNAVEVKVLGPSGTTLDPAGFLPEALDYETDTAVGNVKQGKSYPLEVLTGDAWRDMGLEGVTRWKYVEDPVFMKLFGMSKASFDQLPSWKQIPLKKRHGLF